MRVSTMQMNCIAGLASPGTQLVAVEVVRLLVVIVVFGVDTLDEVANVERRTAAEPFAVDRSMLGSVHAVLENSL